MEKLIVKNFGPIKEVEIEFNKYVVFIGDTSTGKSVLAKLISIFRDSFYLLIGANDEDNTIQLQNQLIRFNINFNIENTEILYFENNVKLLSLKEGEIHLENKTIKNEFKNEFKEIYKESVMANKFLHRFVQIDEEKIMSYMLDETYRQISSTYIPAERVLFSLISDSMAGLLANNIALPQFYKEFAAKFEVSRKSPDLFTFKDLEIGYSYNNGKDNVTVNNVKLLLSEASSGVQSLIPLLLVLESFTKNDSMTNKLFIIEEPELNLFPVKQKKLIDYIISVFNNTNNKLVITTHSPYVLSSLDTLLLAKNTFKEHPDLKEQINAIVSEDKWLDYDDLSVYEVRNDGKAYSIKNEEFQSIDTNAIDGVSDIISKEFDKLTELRYAH